MSLTEAYRLAHTAECRLQLAATRPDRNLRFVVGHLMHYESLRLRIVEIEHDISKSQRASAVKFQGAGEVRRESSKGRRSPPPGPVDVDGDEDGLEVDVDLDDEDDGEGLSLQRFPSGSARPPPLEPDEDDEVEEDEEPASPEEPDQATLEETLKGGESGALAEMYEGVRRCSCHGESGAEQFGRVWELPKGEGEKGREGVTRAVAEVTEVRAKG